MSNTRRYYGGTASYSNLYSNDMDGSAEYALCADTDDHSFTDGAGQDLPCSGVIWMKRDAIGVDSALIVKGIESTGQAEYVFDISNATIRFILQNAAGTMVRARTAPMATVGSWIGLAWTYSGNEATTGIKIYSITTAGVVTQIDNANVSAGAYAGMTRGTAGLKIGAREITAGTLTRYFNGLLYHPQLYDKELSSAELGEIGANPHKDARTYSFGANVVSAWHFPTGTGDYPTWTDYVAGHNATMQNAEAADINTDIP